MVQSAKFKKSFLKWAGGKGRLLEQLFRHIPQEGSVFIEPFLGSGVVFANTDYDKYYLNDSNVDLVNVYRFIKDCPEQFIYSVKEVFNGGNNRTSFNTNVMSYRASQNDFERAVLFYYLNKHCFNGVYRVNKRRGEFNVPFGKQLNPVVSEHEILEFSEILNRKNVFLSSTDFSEFINGINALDDDCVCYMDPPYYPASQTSSFTSYSCDGFSHDDHVHLHELALMLSQQRVRTFLSNSDSSPSWQLYTGHKIRCLDVYRSISSNSKTRGWIVELLVEYIAR